jgi:hypothetical protein
LTGLPIPSSVTSIGDSAFQSCAALSSVTIPASVTNLGTGVFWNCGRLTAINVPAQNLYYSSVYGVLFDHNHATLLQYPCGLGGTYTIPATVTSIGANAFENCAFLTGITIPDSVTSIGDDAFGGCSSLSGITIPGSVTTIGEEAFSVCQNLTNAVISNGVSSIGEDAFFECSALTSLTIPSSVTSIGDYAFGLCSSLAGVYFTGNAPTADSTAFREDNNLTVYYLPGTTGWADFSANTGLPVVLWNPLIQAGGPSFGVQTNHFGFNITATNNFTVVVEACTNLANPVWVPLATNTLVNGSSHFSEPFQPAASARFYALGLP